MRNNYMEQHDYVNRLRFLSASVHNAIYACNLAQKQGQELAEKHISLDEALISKVTQARALLQEVSASMYGVTRQALVDLTKVNPE